MSDTISHATQGGLMLLGPFIAFIRRRVWVWILAFVGAVFGALPDILGAYGFLVNHDDGALSHSAHQGAIADVLQYVPMYWLHLRFDDITRHRHAFVTIKWVLMETVVWGVNLMIAWWYVRIWRKRGEGRGSGLHNNQ